MKQSDRDKDLLERLAVAFDKAWNDRDAKKLADLFVSDADFVYPDGKTLIGTAEIEEEHSERFRNMSQSIRHKLNIIAVRILGAETAVIDSDVTIVDEETQESPPILACCSTAVTTRTNGEWRIAAVRLMIPINST